MNMYEAVERSIKLHVLKTRLELINKITNERIRLEEVLRESLLSEKVNKSLARLVAETFVLTLDEKNLKVSFSVPGEVEKVLGRAAKARMLEENKIGLVPLNIIWKLQDDPTVSFALNPTLSKLQELIRSYHCYVERNSDDSHFQTNY